MSKQIFSILLAAAMCFATIDFAAADEKTWYGLQAVYVMSRLLLQLLIWLKNIILWVIVM